MSNNQFRIQFDKAVAAAMGDAEAIYAIGTDALFNSIIVGKDAPATVVEHSGTPVDTGFARASWWKSIGSVGKHPSPPVKGETIPPPRLGKVGKLTLKDKVFLANSADYINRLEFGHSGQAPQGMVRITIAEAARFWELAKQQLARKG